MRFNSLPLSVYDDFQGESYCIDEFCNSLRRNPRYKYASLIPEYLSHVFIRPQDPFTQRILFAEWLLPITNYILRWCYKLENLKENIEKIIEDGGYTPAIRDKQLFHDIVRINGGMKPLRWNPRIYETVHKLRIDNKVQPSPTMMRTPQPTSFLIQSSNTLPIFILTNHDEIMERFFYRLFLRRNIDNLSSFCYMHEITHLLQTEFRIFDLQQLQCEILRLIQWSLEEPFDTNTPLLTTTFLRLLKNELRHRHTSNYTKVPLNKILPSVFTRHNVKKESDYSNERIQMEGYIAYVLDRINFNEKALLIEAKQVCDELNEIGVTNLRQLQEQLIEKKTIIPNYHLVHIRPAAVVIIQKALSSSNIFDVRKPTQYDPPSISNDHKSTATSESFVDLRDFSRWKDYDYYKDKQVPLTRKRYTSMSKQLPSYYEQPTTYEPTKTMLRSKTGHDNFTYNKYHNGYSMSSGNSIYNTQEEGSKAISMGGTRQSMSMRALRRLLDQLLEKIPVKSSKTLRESKIEGPYIIHEMSKVTFVPSNPPLAFPHMASFKRDMPLVRFFYQIAKQSLIKKQDDQSSWAQTATNRCRHHNIKTVLELYHDINCPPSSLVHSFNPTELVSIRLAFHDNTGQIIPMFQQPDEELLADLEVRKPIFEYANNYTTFFSELPLFINIKSYKPMQEQSDWRKMRNNELIMQYKQQDIIKHDFSELDPRELCKHVDDAFMDQKDINRYFDLLSRAYKKNREAYSSIPINPKVPSTYMSWYTLAPSIKEWTSTQIRTITNKRKPCKSLQLRKTNKKKQAKTNQQK